MHGNQVSVRKLAVIFLAVLVVCAGGLALALRVVAMPETEQAATPQLVSMADPVLVAAGDFGDCSNASSMETADLVSRVPGTVITLGDNAYPDGKAGEYSNCYAPTWGRVLDRTRPASGNHDYRTPGASGYFGYFGARAGDPAKGYYSYDVGTWHIVALNSNCSDVNGCKEGSPEVRWLEADLSAHPSQCTLAYWHHPLFSSGVHGHDADVGEFWRVLYRHHATLVLNGHDHDYERFSPQDPNGNRDRRGIREFVVGTGGAELRPLGAGERNSEARAWNSYGVLTLVLHPRGYDWQFVSVAPARYQDAGSGTCPGAFAQ
ncbi:MAG TPA: metallophosphoesterase [Chloroflexota bacterium]